MRALAASSSEEVMASCESPVEGGASVGSFGGGGATIILEEAPPRPTTPVLVGRSVAGEPGTVVGGVALRLLDAVAASEVFPLPLPLLSAGDFFEIAAAAVLAKISIISLDKTPGGCAP